jgi:hypothetical protein
MQFYRQPGSRRNSKESNQLLQSRLLAGLALGGVLSLWLVLAGSARANVLPAAPGIDVISADEVLRSHTSEMPTGDLVFRESSGALVRLIRSIDDPEILNRGDGSFHPADEATVYASLQEIPARYLRPLQVEIYILPYPRAGRLSSSADSRAIYLSPGVRTYGADQVAFLVTHEMGHILHRRFMPDSLSGLWAEWAILRGVADTSVFNESAVHAYRPHEIFAEDFRVLFGGPNARGNGAIENPDLASPESVPGLREFYEQLIGGRTSLPVASLSLSPNPVRVGQLLTLRVPEGMDVDGAGPTASLVDVSGRVVADLDFRAAGGATFVSSLSSAGGLSPAISAGAYWLRVSTGPGASPSTVPVRVLR